MTIGAGTDVSVCVMVALLLACFSPGSPGALPSFLGPFLPAPSCQAGACAGPVQLAAAQAAPSVDAAESSMCIRQTQGCRTADQGQCRKAAGSCCAACSKDAHHSNGCRCGCADGLVQEGSSCGRQLRQLHVSKADVRQRLAHVSAYCPAARPSRGCLKQVSSFFQQHRLSAQHCIDRDAHDSVGQPQSLY